METQKKKKKVKKKKEMETHLNIWCYKLNHLPMK